jgi:type IV pilus assembly protein PilO
VPALLESISNSARRAGLEISEVAPDGVMNGDHLDTYKYKLGVTGPYHRIAEFLANVASLPRIVAPINLTLAPTSRGVLERRPQRDEVFLDAKFSVQTYVERVAPPALTPSKAGQP